MKDLNFANKYLPMREKADNAAICSMQQYVDANG